MTHDAFIADLERRAAEAEAVGATAPLANVYRAVIAELRALDGQANGTTPLLTVKEAAAILQMTPKWVYRKRLPFLRRVGRAVRVDRAALDRWLASRA